MAINVSQAFKRTSANPIDETIALTKAQMLTVNDNLMPKYYFTICQDDGEIYLYNKSATASATTGKFTKFAGGGGGTGGSEVFKTTKALDTVINNTTTLLAADLPSVSFNDITVGVTIVRDDSGTLALVTAKNGTTSVTTTTMTISGGGSSAYYVDKNGDELRTVYASLDSDQTITANNTAVNFVKRTGNIEQPAAGKFTIPDGVKVELKYNHSSSAPQGDIIFGWYNDTDSTWITDKDAAGGLKDFCPFVNNSSSTGYIMGASYVVQWENTTGHPVNISIRAKKVNANGKIREDYTSLSITEVSRVVDPVAYLDNSKGLQDTPVGNIISYMGNSVPRHYLPCDGATYNIGQYPALEAHFIEEFGKVNHFGGDGITTWAVPDLQGEFLRGAGTNSHTNQGDGGAVGKHQDGTEAPYSGFNQTTGNLWSNSNTPNAGASLSVSNVDSWHSTTSTQGRFYKSDGVWTADNGRMTYMSRPTNTSVKYCIKYESTMQVIFGNTQYKVSGTYTVSATINAWQINPFTAAKGDTSLIDANGIFHAPETGYYQLTATTGWTSESNIWMSWQKRDTNIPGNTQEGTNQYQLLGNTGNTIYRETLSGAVYLEKGDPVTLHTYHYDKAVVPTGKFEWSIVMLTSSVNINEVNLIAADDVYSTDEQLIGSYNGKPLYRKTVEFGKMPANAEKKVAHNISNLEQFTKVDIRGYDSGYWFSIPYAQSSNNINTAVAGLADATYVYIRTGMDRTANTATFYLEYTKTTDAANSAPNKNSLLLNRPDLWTPNTEIDFGGGLYGKRITGNTTLVSHQRNDIIVASGISSSGKVVSQGGSVFTAANWKCPVPWGYANHSSSGGTQFETAVYTSLPTSDIRLYLYTDVAPGATSYDVWVTYTK